MELPDREQMAEDAWVHALYEVNADRLVEAIRETIEAGRPRLAARVVGLLTEGVADDDPLVERARKAAAFLYSSKRASEPLSPFEDLLVDLHARRVRRFKQRRYERENKGARRRPRWWQRTGR